MSIDVVVVAASRVESDGDTVVSSDEKYEEFAPRLDLKTVDDRV